MDFVKKENDMGMFTKQYVCKVCNILYFEYYESEKGIFCKDHMKMEIKQ